MDTTGRNARLKSDLIDRRHRLEAAMVGTEPPPDVGRLLGEVDASLERMEAGTYGVCEYCGDAIEDDRLRADPLVRFCIDHMSASQQSALERDLELASRVQGALLPRQDLRFGGWEVHYHYEAAGLVSGDYCDLQTRKDASLFFVVGDVAGKGVAASILTAHLNASFRTLAGIGLPLGQLVAHANRLFCESTMDAHFATLVCGAASASGDVELCSAGHVPPLLVRGGKVTRIEATGLPVGIFCSVPYAVTALHLSPGDTLFLYTDGLSEARDRAGAEYEVDRISRLLGQRHQLSPADLARACLQDLATFRSGAPLADDLTFMVIRRAP